jgi:hypothetical protein
MVNYAAELSNAAAGENIFHFLEQVLINKTDLIMTYGQVLESRGRVKGMQTRA